MKTIVSNPVLISQPNLKIMKKQLLKTTWGPSILSLLTLGIFCFTGCGIIFTIG